ncbi:hypothetical protein ABIE41_003879 [Bosea sp. OAE506]
MQTNETTPRERLRQALVAAARAHAQASAGTKGPETGEPASGQGPSEPRGWSVLGWEARLSGTEGREEGGRGTPSGQAAESGQ